MYYTHNIHTYLVQVAVGLLQGVTLGGDVPSVCVLFVIVCVCKLCVLQRCLRSVTVLFSNISL